MKIKITILLVQLFWFVPVAISQNLSDRSETIPLWTSVMPDGTGPHGNIRANKNNSLTNIAQPFLIVHCPERPNGTAVLVISGGGYAHIEQGNESGPAADWLASQGVTAFELIYRLPQEGWESVNVPFEDGQRALRLVRSKARRYSIDSHKIGVLGFSAGGHLAGMLATQYNVNWYTPTDKIDTYSSRPDFAALLYPVITMMPPYNHTHNYKVLIGNAGTNAKRRLYSDEVNVTTDTPPMFLAQAEDDPISPVQNSKLMYKALKEHRVPAEIHIFPTAGHGWGMGTPGSPVAQWPDMFRSWAVKMDFF